MSDERILKPENHRLLFEKTDHKGEFIAEACGDFSEYMEKHEFSRNWAHSNFDCGRYVIMIYQRHSVYQSGQRIWLNKHFDNSVGTDSRYKFPNYAIILDHSLDYTVKTWKKLLRTYTVHDENNPLQVKMYNLSDAESEAKRLSENGSKSVIVEWFEDYDMY